MNLRDIHTPVLLERCIELLAPGPAARTAPCSSMRRSAWAGTPRRSSSASPASTSSDSTATRTPSASRGSASPRFGDRVTLVHTVYDGIVEAVHSAGFEKADAVLFDLGVSSLQLDVADRGFAYSQDAPLDMRMDQTTGPTAADVLATYSEGQLRAIFERYGEEKLSARYARFIIAARREAPIERSGRLVEILVAATPAAAQRAGHPAKRVFQALRIEVNAELAAVERAIPAALDVLPVGGRIVVLSYQSLEDRIVKRALSAATASTAPSGPSRRAAGARPPLPPARQGRRARRRRGARAQPARDAGAPARRRESEGCRMSAAAASALRPERAPSPSRPRTRAGGCAPSSRRRPGASARAWPTRSSPSPERSPSAPRRWCSRSARRRPRTSSRSSTQEKRDLTWEKQALYDDVAGLSSPQYLAANAAALGMVINAVADLPAPERRGDHRHQRRGGARPRRWMPWAAAPSANALVAETPLITAPDATIQGAPVEAAAAARRYASPATDRGSADPEHTVRS